MVTSRRRLDGLVARSGARLLPLATLDAAPATRLLLDAAEVAGVPITAEQAAELARLCDHLPLALRVVAARLAVQPARTVANLVVELSDERTRLAALDLEDADTSVRAALDVSYRGLHPRPGPKGVGDAVNESVVITFVLLFLVNLAITTVYLRLVPGKGA